MDKRSYNLCSHPLVRKEQAGATGMSDSKALHLITMQHGLLIPCCSKHQCCYYNPVIITPIILPPMGNFEELLFLKNFNLKFHSKGNPAGQRPLDFAPRGPLLWNSNKSTSYLTGVLLSLERTPQGLMQKEVLLWMWHQLNLYLVKKVIHSCIQQWYLLNVSYILNWILLGYGERSRNNKAYARHLVYHFLGKNICTYLKS